jgi:hypothetical protein
MSISERRSYYAARYDDTMVSAHTALLRQVDGIIFCFPHWWFSMPAMLAARYGDTTNRRVYMMSRDVERRWLDLHRCETGAAPPID